LGDFQAGLAGEADHFAGEEAQPGGATVELVAPLEERLVADANAEERPARGDECLHALQQFLAPERRDAVVERADAG